MIYHLSMDEKMVMLDGLIVKQAVRDVASKKPELSDQALLYFYSRDFLDLCQRNMIDGNAIIESIKSLVDFPIISRKKIANGIAKVIDDSFLEDTIRKNEEMEGWSVATLKENLAAERLARLEAEALREELMAKIKNLKDKLSR